MSKWAHENALEQPQKFDDLYCVCCMLGCYGYVAKNSQGKEWMSRGEAKKLQSTIGVVSTLHRFGDE